MLMETRMSKWFLGLVTFLKHYGSSHKPIPSVHLAMSVPVSLFQSLAKYVYSITSELQNQAAVNQTIFFELSFKAFSRNPHSGYKNLIPIQVWCDEYQLRSTI